MIIGFLLIASVLTAVVSFILVGEATVVFYSYGIVVPLLMVIPHLAHHFYAPVRKTLHKKGLRFIDLFMFGILVINVPGSLYFHQAGIQYDRIIHFGVALLVFLLIVMLRILLLSDRDRLPAKVQLLTTSFIGLFAGLFVWEGYQYSVDQIFGSKLFFDAAQNIYVDVSEDILYGLAGMIVALIYTVVSYKKLLKALE